jgi:ankyrin repeat protein
MRPIPRDEVYQETLMFDADAVGARMGRNIRKTLDFVSRWPLAEKILAPIFNLLAWFEFWVMIGFVFPWVLATRANCGKEDEITLADQSSGLLYIQQSTNRHFYGGAIALWILITSEPTLGNKAIEFLELHRARKTLAWRVYRRLFLLYYQKLLKCYDLEPKRRDIYFKTIDGLTDLARKKKGFPPDVEIPNTKARNDKEVETLLDASSAEDLTQLNELLGKGAEINCQDGYGQTPVLTAIAWKRQNIARRLIDIGADVNRADLIGWTPLGQAVRSGQWEIVDQLIDAGANPNAREERHGRTPLLDAISLGEMEVVQRLIHAGADLNAKSLYGETTLGLAVAFNRFDLVRLLLEAGADVNMKDDQGLTPLIVAVAYGHEDIVRELVAAGADVNLRDNNALSPLHWAVCGKRDSMVPVLIEAGAFLNTKTVGGRTPLHLAVEKDFELGVSILVEAGADIRLKDRAGRTPWELAKSDAVARMVFPP